MTVIDRRYGELYRKYVTAPVGDVGLDENEVATLLELVRDRDEIINDRDLRIEALTAERDALSAARRIALPPDEVRKWALVGKFSPTLTSGEPIQSAEWFRRAEAAANQSDAEFCFQLGWLTKLVGETPWEMFASADAIVDLIVPLLDQHARRLGDALENAQPADAAAQ